MGRSSPAIGRLSAPLNHPFITVLIRSYNRLGHVLEIVELCRRQTYDNFEVVILEQSTDDHFEEHRAEMDNLDDRFRVIRKQPLGGTGARNYGVAYSKGDVVLFMDDDDLPVGDNWIAAHAKNYADPNCIGVSGRHIHELGEIARYADMERAYSKCLTITLFMRGRVFTGIEREKKPVQWLHGNNCSLRRETIIKLGGWYPHVKSDHEEHSLYFKFHKSKKTGEYLKFDPIPTVLRRFKIAGGVERRTISLRELLDHRLRFCHWVIGVEFPWRFYGLYPLFMISSFRIAARHLRKGSEFTDVYWIHKLGLTWGKRFYIWQELILFPLMIARFLLSPRPQWDGDILGLTGAASIEREN